MSSDGKIKTQNKNKQKPQAYNIMWKLPKVKLHLVT